MQIMQINQTISNQIMQGNKPLSPDRMLFIGRKHMKYLNFIHHTEEI